MSSGRMSRPVTRKSSCACTPVVMTVSITSEHIHIGRRYSHVHLRWTHVTLALDSHATVSRAQQQKANGCTPENMAGFVHGIVFLLRDKHKYVFPKYPAGCVPEMLVYLKRFGLSFCACCSNFTILQSAIGCARCVADCMICAEEF